MKIEVRDQGPVFRDGCFSHPENIFILRCERGSLMRVYMKIPSGGQPFYVRYYLVLLVLLVWLVWLVYVKFFPKDCI